ncbi:Checkpoint protein [Chamberlinius hualienensis]
MKFRGIITDSTCINHFSKVIGTVAKLAKGCIIRLTDDKVYFIRIQSGNRHTCYMWCELEQSHFFQDYCMTGLSEEQNEIYLDVSTDNMVQALKLAQNAKKVVIKLTKRHGASLTFDIELPTVSTGSRFLSHDVPVVLVQTVFWSEYQEPVMPKYNISLILSSLVGLKNIVERMKHLGNVAMLSATSSGSLSLKIETETVAITSTFTNLQRTNPTDRDQTFATYETAVDIKHLAQFLSCQQLLPNRIVCNVQAERVVHFLISQQGLLLQYLMPAISV